MLDSPYEFFLVGLIAVLIGVIIWAVYFSERPRKLTRLCVCEHNGLFGLTTLTHFEAVLQRYKQQVESENIPFPSDGIIPLLFMPRLFLFSRRPVERSDIHTYDEFRKLTRGCLVGSVLYEGLAGERFFGGMVSMLPLR